MVKEGGIHGRGAYMAGGVHGEGHAWQRACVTRGACMVGGKCGN